jgi:hypothetical protein
MPTRPDAAPVVSEAAPDEDTVDALALLAASSLAVLSSSAAAAVGLVPSSSPRAPRWADRWEAAWAGSRSHPSSQS